MEYAEKTGREGWIIDDVFVAEKYFRWLKGLIETGELPADARAMKEGERERGVRFGQSKT